MIDFICGKLDSVIDKKVTLVVGGFGLCINLPQTQNLKTNDDIKLYCHVHWNQDKGPTLFGFHSKFDREVFIAVIGCSQIGPSIAINILSQMSALQFLNLIVTQDSNGLSSINGIGSKKADQLILQLKRKSQKLLMSEGLPSDQSSNAANWQHVSGALSSLNYSKAEISNAIDHIAKTKN